MKNTTGCPTASVLASSGPASRGADPVLSDANQRLRRILDTMEKAQRQCEQFLQEHGRDCRCGFCSNALRSEVESTKAMLCCLGHMLTGAVR